MMGGKIYVVILFKVFFLASLKKFLSFVDDILREKKIVFPIPSTFFPYSDRLIACQDIFKVKG